MGKDKKSDTQHASQSEPVAAEVGALLSLHGELVTNSAASVLLWTTVEDGHVVVV